MSPRPSMLALFALGSPLAPSSSEACSVDGPEAHEIDAASTDTTPPSLEAVAVSIRRADHPGECGSHGDCGNIASITLAPVASDDQASASQMGFELAIIDGEFPSGGSLPDVAVRSDGSGEIWLPFADDGEAFRFTASVTAIDLAGNPSDRIVVEVADAENDNGCGLGCSVALGAPRQGAWLLGSPLLALLLVRRRRLRGRR